MSCAEEVTRPFGSPLGGDAAGRRASFAQRWPGTQGEASAEYAAISEFSSFKAAEAKSLVGVGSH